MHQRVTAYGFVAPVRREWPEPLRVLARASVRGNLPSCDPVRRSGRRHGRGHGRGARMPKCSECGYVTDGNSRIESALGAAIVGA
jgi:hypothetical protein